MSHCMPLSPSMSAVWSVLSPFPFPVPGGARIRAAARDRASHSFFVLKK